MPGSIRTIIVNDFYTGLRTQSSYRTDSITFIISESNARLSQSEKVYSLKMKAYNSSEVMRKKERERVNTKIVKAVGLNDIIKLQRHWQHISITFGLK